MRKLKVLLAMLALASGYASAQTIVVNAANPEYVNATSITPYYGFSLYADQPSGGSNTVETMALPTFVTSETFAVIVNGNPSVYYQGATHLIVDGTSYTTGELNNNQHNSNMALLDTLTLGNIIPASFQLGVLTDVQGSNTTQLTITLNNASGTQLGSVTEGVSGSESQGANDIYNSIITGATAGDTLNFYTTSSGYDSIGGIFFDLPTISVPEPRTWALLLGGMAFLGFSVFRRRQQA